MTAASKTRHSFSAALVCAACLISFLAGCTAKPTGYSDFDVATDFTGFRTFAFVPERTLLVASPDPVNPALEPILIDETRKYLVRHGYRYSENPAEADFLVGFSLGQTPTARTTAFTSNQRQVYVVGRTLDDQTVTQQGTEAGLVIDVIDRASGSKKWMGWAVEEITMGDRKRLRLTVSEVVDVILQHFPPDVPARD